MSKPPLPDEAIALLRRPNPAVIATLRKDGSPVTTATWYLWEDDGRVLVNMDEGRVRLTHVRHDPRVSLTVLAEDGWTTHITVLGRVVEIKDDDGLTDIDRISSHYTGHPYSNRDRGRVSAWIEVDRWHGWGAHKDSNQTG
ncbi:MULTISPECIES: PPOX class F420-dependent oxidoreductase [Mumia]|uniref:PPOX class F420-dependent oxidoreductase n=1 Tax=Mumia TaxID=1546255 RepID=UPI00142302A4|nr:MULTISPECIES: PPOX class F420-dependent oxidoreductase [unclassified Mumia]QMW68059.1 PPOX class F420-dependent oxidoreductase [Mumia sp. ZJ1417]